MKRQRYIAVSAATREKMMKVFGCTAKTVTNALYFNGGDSDLRKRIRRMAMECGGVMCVTAPAVETFHSADGMMTQYLDNGAVITMDTATGRCVVTKNGRKAAEYDDVMVRDILKIQQAAAAL